jgi:signal peptidase I
VTERFLRELREYLGALAVAFLVVTFGFTTVGVAGSSVEPTLDGGSGQLPESLLVGDRLFIPKYETWLRRPGVMCGYQRGDIVIAREPADSPVR